MTLPITALYAGILGLLLLFLSAQVVRQRGKQGVGLGDGGKAPLQQAIRAHGNFIEFVPMVLILIGLIELAGYPAAVVHGLGAALVVARVAHAVGLSKSAGTSKGRFVGAALTFTLLGIASLLVLAKVLL